MDPLPKKSNVTRSGARRLGDEFQDIVAIDILVEWLEHPDRYQWIRLEADDFEFLDDVVALRKDNTLDVIQVKHSTHPEDATDPWSWKALLTNDVGKSRHPAKSLIQKWANSLIELKENWNIHEACVYTNREPAPDLFESLSNTLVIFDKIVSQETRDKICNQLGSEEIARDFFSQFHFYLDQPDWKILEQATSRRFYHLGCDERGWNSLLSNVRNWVIFRNEPPPDGIITFSRVQTASLWHELQSFPQEFEIPSDYVLPSEQFHSDLLAHLLEMNRGTLVLYGSPGSGKSTYTSVLFQNLRGKDVPVIRHHYFLSLSDRDLSYRIDHLRAAESLMTDIKDQYPEAIATLKNFNPSPADIRKWLETCGAYFSAQGKALIVILDGLDHVWREGGSFQELGKVLDNFQPSIDGIVLYVATQPIDDSKLPHSLLRVAPRDTWLELPVLDELAVKSWVELHSNDLAIPGDGPARDYHLERISSAFYNKSSGHPLHLKYSLRALQEQGIAITELTIQQLPECSHKDIIYYYNELWRGLTEDSRSIVHLFATSMFPWQRPGLIDYLSLQGIQTDQALVAFRQIKHLLIEGEIGLQPFHSSLLNFVKDLPEHIIYEESQKHKVLEWLQTKAPDHWRWSYEWLIGDDLGNSAPLIYEPNRQWLISALVKCRTKQDIERILTRSTEAALEAKDLPRAVETGILREYLDIAYDFIHDVLEALFYPQLIVEDDPLLRARLRSNFRYLSPTEIYYLAEAESNSDKENEVKQCFDELNNEVRKHRLKVSYEVPPKWEEWVSSNLKVAALYDSVSPARIIHWALRNRESSHTLEMIETYSNELRARKDIKRFRQILFEKMIEDDEEITFEGLEPQEQAIIIRNLVLLALEEGLAIDDCILKFNLEANPFAYIYAVLRKLRGFKPREITFPEIKLLSINRYEVYSHVNEIKTIFYNTFYTLLANYLVNYDTVNQDWLEDVGEFSWSRHFVQILNKTAHIVADFLLNGAHLSLGWFYSQFSELSVPQFRHGEGDYYYFIAATNALTRIGFDLLCISRTENNVPSISMISIATIVPSPYFNSETWLTNYIGQRRKLLETEALQWFISEQKGALSSKNAPLNERSHGFCQLASLSALHGLDDSTRELICLTAENLIGHYSHKDLLINEVMEVILAFHSAVTSNHVDISNFVKPEDCLLALAPAIAQITEFTDGDETNHLPEKMADALVEINIDLLPIYYQWLVDIEEHYDALHVFQAFVQAVDLSDPINSAIAKTAVDRGSLVILAERANNNDPGAEEVLESILAVLGRSAVGLARMKEELSYNTNNSDEKEAPDLKLYPPDRLNDYIEELEIRNIIVGKDERIEEWASYWISEGRQEDIFQAIKSVSEQRRHFRHYDLLVSLALQLYGAESAYPWLIRGMNEDHAWFHYFVQKEKILKRWEIIKKYFPDRWFLFIRDTFWNGRETFLRLVEYCIFMGQLELASVLVTRMVNITLELVSPLNFPVPEWIEIAEKQNEI